MISLTFLGKCLYTMYNYKEIIHTIWFCFIISHNGYIVYEYCKSIANFTKTLLSIRKIRKVEVEMIEI